MLALACRPVQTAEVPDTPAPETEAPSPTPETVVIETPAAESILFEKTTLPPLPTFAPTPTPSPTPTPTPTPTPAPLLAGFTIGIDPGHQQRVNTYTEPIAPDSDVLANKCSAGTRGIMTGVYEYEVALNVALKLKALLEESGATVAITRTTNNVNLSNRDRGEFFGNREVDFAISLHCNGADDPGIRGAFVLVPTRERTQSYNENVRAAQTILERYCAETGLETRKRSGIVYREDQALFNWCNRPIICLEMGHLSNETEDLLLTNGAFQDKMAVGVYRGIVSYLVPDSDPEGGTP